MNIFEDYVRRSYRIKAVLITEKNMEERNTQYSYIAGIEISEKIIKLFY